jgi:hypothetical protein
MNVKVCNAHILILVPPPVWFKDMSQLLTSGINPFPASCITILSHREKEHNTIT